MSYPDLTCMLSSALAPTLAIVLQMPAAWPQSIAGYRTRPRAPARAPAPAFSAAGDRPGGLCSTVNGLIPDRAAQAMDRS